jgi:2-methylisocitrate lyase-like PEP mutase family enzyme
MRANLVTTSGPGDASPRVETPVQLNVVMTAFGDLHSEPLPLLLPNAWDVSSALAFVAARYRAIGTTSLGVAASHGVPDGGRGTRESNLTLARSLARLPVLVSVDSEDGYSDDPAEVAAYVAELSALGVVGVNLEDSLAGRLVEPGAFAGKVAAVKESAPDVFVNARVDTYWFHQDETVEATLRRATAFVEAGADGIFVPGLDEPEAIRAITDALPVPVNLLPMPGRSLADLAALGVRRVSTGSLPYRVAVAAAVESAAAVRDGSSLPASVPYGELQAALTAFAGDT